MADPVAEKAPSKVLLVDDEPLILKLFTLRLRQHAHLVDSCLNGRVAVKIAQRNRYDAILMDMNMPDMDGHQATRMLRGQGYRGLIIAVTAAAMADNIKQAMDSGCDQFITTPVDDDFELVIEKMISEFHSAESEKDVTR